MLLGGLVSLAAGSGCESAPPVQEMSDARQAIAVARDAGAEQIAAAELSEAEALLDSARRN
ncbi:MAG: lipoprotein LipL71, partial [Pseudomonadota bacterium]